MRLEVIGVAEGMVSLRLPDADLASLKLAAAERNTTISEVVRDALRLYLAQDSAVRVQPLIDAAVGKHADRLAALICKVFVAAEMGSWQARALMTVLGPKDIDPATTWREARTRALIDLRQSGTDRWGEDDLYPGDAAGPALGGDT